MTAPGTTETHIDASLSAAETMVRSIADLASLPDTTLEVLRLLSEPTSSVRDMERAVSRDPGLASRLLRLVNSAYFGLPFRVGSVQKAISLLGVGALRDVVVAATLEHFFRGGPAGSGLEPSSLWRHSLAAATAARRLALLSPTAPREEGFLCGLLHDVGIMAALHANRLGYLQAFDSASEEGVSLLVAERRRLGADHAEIGRALCEWWRFPEALSVAAGFHHEPDAAPQEHAAAAWLALAADRLAAQSVTGWRGDLATTEIPADALEALQLTPATLAEVADRLRRGLESA